MKWLLIRIMRIVELAIREIAFLMKDSYSRFRNNTKLFQACVDAFRTPENIIVDCISCTVAVVLVKLTGRNLLTVDSRQLKPKNTTFVQNLLVFSSLTEILHKFFSQEHSVVPLWQDQEKKSKQN